jgi:hypothetical protein
MLNPYLMMPPDISPGHLEHSDSTSRIYYIGATEGLGSRLRLTSTTDDFTFTKGSAYQST